MSETQQKTTKAKTGPKKPTVNANKQYKVLKKFRFGGEWHEVGTVLTRAPSAAHYYLTINKLEEIK